VQAFDNAIFVGCKFNKGIAFRFTVTTSTNVMATAALQGTPSFTQATVTSSNAAIITAPTGGMGQFKGLTQGTEQDKYVSVVCKGVAPLYVTTWAAKLDSETGNGWMLTCYTGIAQCGQDTSATTGLVVLSSSEATNCMNDPRYMTWRAMTMKVLIDGTQSWYRTDSYWNSASTSFSSTMGTGVILSTNWVNGVNDNFVASSGSTIGRTFVFAYGDGSGI
jgi:hypothetical protein